MSHPSYSPYDHPYTPPGGSQPPRRNTALVGGIVIACTALVLGSILLVTLVVNRGDGDPPAEEDGVEEVADGGETTAPAEEAAEGDPAEVAVTIVEIMFGQSDQSSEGLVCADPDPYLVDLEATGEATGEMLGETSGMVGYVAGDTTDTDTGVTVEVAMAMGGTEAPFATVDLVVEDGSWKACGFAF